MFINNKLRVIDKNSDYKEENQEEVNSIMLDDEVKQAIASKEDISAAYASAKESNISGVFRLEYLHECIFLF